jgi:tetratricopeptide (TPR) repeat protein
MRKLALALIWLLGLSSPTLADQTDPRLAGLFRALREAPDESAAAEVEASIWATWLQSGRASIDLLMTRGLAAQEAKDVVTAQALFDAVTELAPNFAEGWNRRASARREAGDLAGAVSDLERALALEPRHFGALLGLAAILEQEGQPRAALEAARRALALNPHLKAAEEKIRALMGKLEGRGI